MERPKAVHVSKTPRKPLNLAPVLRTIFSFLTMGVAVVNYFDFCSAWKLPTTICPVPNDVTNILLFIAGFWIFLMVLESNMSRRRREILKRYI